MPEGKDQDKTEPATPKRLEDARNKGQVAQSREIPSTLVLLAGVLVIYFFGSNIGHNLQAIIGGLLSNIGAYELTNTRVYNLMRDVLGQVGLLLAPLFIVLLVAGLAGNLLQNGFLFTLEPLVPKLSKLDPIKGVKKLFSAQSLVELIKSIAKITIVGSVTFLTVKGEQENILPIMMMEPISILTYIGKVSFKICIQTLWVLVPLVALDYTFQRWKHSKDLRRSR